MLVKCLQMLKWVGAIKVNCYGCSQASQWCHLTKIKGKPILCAQHNICVNVYNIHVCTHNPPLCNGLHHILLPRKIYSVVDIKIVNIVSDQFIVLRFCTLLPFSSFLIIPVCVFLNECLEMRFIHVIKFAQNIQYNIYRFNECWKAPTPVFAC